MTFLFLLLTSLSLLGVFLLAKRSVWGIAVGGAHLLALAALLTNGTFHSPQSKALAWLAMCSLGWGGLLWQSFQILRGRYFIHHKSKELAPPLEGLQDALKHQGNYSWLPQKDLVLQGSTLIANAKKNAITANAPAAQIDVWIRYVIEQGKPHTVLGAATSLLPMGLELMPQQTQESAITTWFPSLPAKTLETPPGWKPQQGLFGEVSVCLGRLSSGLHVEGVERDILPLFNAATRAKIDTLQGEGALELTTGTLTLIVPAHIVDTQHLQALLQQVVALVEALALDKAAQRRQLADMITTEPAPALQLRSLELLQQLAPHSPQTIELCQWAAKQPAPAWRFLGALHLKPQDGAILHALFEDEEAPKELRCLALQALLQSQKGEVLWALYAEILGHDDALFWSQTLKHIEQGGTRGALKPLIEAVQAATWPPPSQLLPGILRAFGACANVETFPESGAEEQTLRMLALPIDQNLTKMLLRLLTSWGSPAALLPLHQIKRRKSWAPMIPDVDLCCEHIRNRMDPAEAGQLSLSHAEDEGQLSLQPEVDGRVSLVANVDGQLSLQPEADNQNNLSMPDPTNKP